MPWGSKTAIQSLLGAYESEQKPLAGLWMGAHPKAPSQVFWDGEWRPRDGLIEAYPDAVLGKAVAQKLSRKLPFLFKISA